MCKKKIKTMKMKGLTKQNKNGQGIVVSGLWSQLESLLRADVNACMLYHLYIIRTLQLRCCYLMVNDAT